mgnify:FL=1
MKHLEMPNYGYIFDEMPDSVLSKVRNQCLVAKDYGKTHNHLLAGQLEEEWQININTIDPEIRQYILYAARQYADYWNYLQSIRMNSSDCIIDLTHMWVNYQQKGEYNPIHNHGGVFSFVMWVDIPFSYEEEAEISIAKKSNRPQCGRFNFHYSNMLGGIVSHPIEAKAGDFALFPAGLNHSVAPFFTSDGYRVSVSGNLCYIT